MARKQQMDKAQSQRAHAKRRARERYGLHINRDLYRELVQRIQLGRARIIERQSNRIAVHLLEIDGVQYPVAYDNQRQTIVTFLPQEYMEGREA